MVKTFTTEEQELLDQITLPSNFIWQQRLPNIPENFRNDEDFMLAAVTISGMALEFASDDLKNKKAVVTAAVTQTGWALEFASD